MNICRIRIRRRGIAAIAMVALLLIAEVIVVSMVLSGTRDHDLTLRRLDTVRAFYAAEAGMNMAVRELIRNADEDGDGGIGSISDDGNAANDPSMCGGWVVVSVTDDSGQWNVRSSGRAGGARRSLDAVLE